MNTINLDQAFAIQNIINTMDDSVRLFPAYSGKFMYGAECAGYAVHNVAIVGIAVAQVLTRTDIDVSEVLADCRTDDLGMQTIVYFPRLQIDLSEPVTVANIDDLDASDWKEALDVDTVAEFEAEGNIKLVGEALAFCEAIIADGVINVNTNETTEEDSLVLDGVTYTGEALISLRYVFLDDLEVWGRATLHFYEGLACEKYMTMAIEFSAEVPYNHFDYYEDYAWNTLHSAWKAMGLYMAKGKFSDDPELGEAKMREVWEWLDGWHKYHNASDASTV